MSWIRLEATPGSRLSQWERIESEEVPEGVWYTLLKDQGQMMEVSYRISASGPVYEPSHQLSLYKRVTDLSVPKGDRLREYFSRRRVLT